MIRPFAEPLMERAGFLVLKGNLFDFAIMKTSVISEEFRKRYLSQPGQEGVFEARAVVFDGSDDYHHRINDPALGDRREFHPGDPRRRSDRLARLGRGGQHAAAGRADPAGHRVACRRSATAASRARRTAPRSSTPRPRARRAAGFPGCAPATSSASISNAGRCDALVDEAEIARRKAEGLPEVPPSHTPWEELYREKVGQLGDGAVLEMALKYRRVSERTPRHNH